MKVATTIFAVLVGLLSIAAGAAKIALVPEEVSFLSQFGFTSLLTVTFGIAQVLGGLLLIVPTTRFFGSAIAGLAFAFSVVLLLIGGNLAFAGVSLIPAGLAGLIAYQNRPGQPASASSDEDA